MVNSGFKGLRVRKLDKQAAQPLTLILITPSVAEGQKAALSVQQSRLTTPGSMDATNDG